MSNKGPVVSTIVITYNQERYVAQALQSIIDQVTDFRHEIIVADDSSQDDTQNIISRFAEKYPDVIKPILRNKNIGAWENFTDAIQKAKGEYIALCEGDDYWINTRKLQKQVNFLRKHSDYSLCFHPVLVHYEDSELEDAVFPKKKTGFTVKGLLKSNYIQTNSVLYRKRDYTKLAKNIMPGDWYLHLYHASFGKIGFINEVMSTYRRHSAGLWWESRGDITKIWRKYGVGHLILYREMLRLFGESLPERNIINNHINVMMGNILKLENADDIKEASLNIFPESMKSFILYFQSLSANLEIENEKLKTDIHHRNLEINRLRHEMGLIKGSKTWRIRNKLARAIGKEKV